MLESLSYFCVKTFNNLVVHVPQDTLGTWNFLYPQYVLYLE